MKRFRSFPPEHRPDFDAHGRGTATCRPQQTSSPRSATTSAPSVLAAAREADVLPYFHVLTSPAMPVVEMEGAERIMLGSNNYLGLTGDERVLAGRRGRAAPLRHRADRLAPAERHDPAAPRARARDRRVDGDRGRDRLHDRPPGEPRHARHAARARRTRSSSTPATTRRSSTAACSRARSCAPFRHNRLDKLEKMLRARAGRRRRRARRRRRRLLDGGRHRAAARRSASCASATARA